MRIIQPPCIIISEQIKWENLCCAEVRGRCLRWWHNCGSRYHCLSEGRMRLVILLNITNVLREETYSSGLKIREKRGKCDGGGGWTQEYDKNEYEVVEWRAPILIQTNPKWYQHWTQMNQEITTARVTGNTYNCLPSTNLNSLLTIYLILTQKNLMAIPLLGPSYKRKNQI